MPEFINPGFDEFIEANVRDLAAGMIWMKSKTMLLSKSVGGRFPDDSDLTQFIDGAIKAGICVVDVETTGLNTRTKKNPDGTRSPIERIVSFCLSYDGEKGLYVPVRHKVGSELNLPEAEVFAEIKRLCDNCVTIYHNAKFDLNVLKNHGILVTQHNRYEDTMLLARLFDAGQKEIGLKHLADKLLGQKMIDFDEITGGSGQINMISPATAYLYGCSDAICTYGLYKFFMASNIIKEQMSIYNLEKRLVFVVMEMESNLIKIDVDYLKRMKSLFEARLEKITEEVYRLAGREFNIGSPLQLGKLLFEDLAYDYPETNAVGAMKKTASGQYLTDTSTLEKIQDRYPIVKLIIEYRALEKASGTYITNLLNNIDEDGCVKIGFNQVGTDTGRFSSPGGRGLHEDGYSGVNVQSLPASYDDHVPKLIQENHMRVAFVARPGYKIVALDYSGEELRISANISKEPKWIHEFIHGNGDLHTQTAQTIFNKKEISKGERKIAKTANFLVIYLGGPQALAMQTRISEREARRIMAAYFEGVPVLRRWIDTERAKARKIKFVKTALGRVRPLAVYYNSGDKGMEAHGDRCAVNTQIQGTAADIIKTAMVRVYNWIHSHGLQDEIRMLLTMHDELVFEIKEDKMMEHIPKLNDIMKLKDILQDILQWPVPLKIDAEYGDSWDVDHNFFEEHPELENIEAVKFTRYAQILTPPLISETTVQESAVSEPVPETPVMAEPVPETPVMAEPVPETPVVAEPVPETPVVAGPVPETPVVAEPVPETPVVAEPVPETPVFDTVDGGQNFIYTIRDRDKGTLRRINDILLFLLDESNNGARYQGAKGTLMVRDREGNQLSVSEFKIQTDAFLALARYFGL